MQFIKISNCNIQIGLLFETLKNIRIIITPTIKVSLMVRNPGWNALEKGK